MELRCKSRSLASTQEEEWAEYLEKEKLNQYTALIDLFTPAIKEVLLDDPTLRPVFLQVLPEDKLGPFTIIDKEAIEEIGGEEFLLNHSAFLVGTAEIADIVVKKGHKIIIGAADRYYPRIRFNVANGRQCYFPLADGTWLGIKGSGQFAYETRLPYYWHDNASYPDMGWYHGLMDETGLEHIEQVVGLLKKSKARFVLPLAYRRLYALPNGIGYLNETRELRDPSGSEVKPVIVFNRVLSPHRLSKLLQLLKTDPGLERLRRRISNTLVNLGYLPLNKVLSAEKMMLMIAQEMGYAEAIKQNLLYFKYTIHSQDFTFAGEEADINELYPYEPYAALLQDKSYRINENRSRKELLLEHKLGIIDLGGKYTILCDMICDMIGIDQWQDEKLFPSPINNIKALFRTYFRYLDDQYLELWVKKSDGDCPRPLLENFNDAILRMRGDLLPGELKGIIIDLAQKEANRRRKSKSIKENKNFIIPKDRIHNSVL